MYQTKANKKVTARPSSRGACNEGFPDEALPLDNERSLAALGMTGKQLHKKNPFVFYNHLGAMLFVLLHIQICFALSEDRDKIMLVSAGSADLNHQTHRGIYIKDVQLDQGTTHIRAAQAITEGNLKNQLTKAIIKGNNTAQAHFWTTTSVNKPPMHAYANTIHYYPERHLIVLIGNARVEQGADSFSAPTISYDTLHKHVISKHNNKGRTMIIIHSRQPHE